MVNISDSYVAQGHVFESLRAPRLCPPSKAIHLYCSHPGRRPGQATQLCPCCDTCIGDGTLRDAVGNTYQQTEHIKQ